MVTRSRQVIATFAVSALLAGGAVAHAATNSSGSAAKSTSTSPAAAMDENAATTQPGEELPEHGRRFDSVDHSVDDPVHDTVDVRFRHVDVFDRHLTRALVRLTSPVSAFSSRRHVPAARRGSLPVSPPASRAALVAAALAALVLLAAGCGWIGCSGAVPSTTAANRGAIGQGLRGPAGTKATVYATGLRNVSAFAFDTSGRLWATTSAASDHARDGVYVIRRRAPLRSR